LWFTLKLSNYQQRIVLYILKDQDRSYTIKDFPFGCIYSLDFNLRELAANDILIRTTERVKRKNCRNSITRHYKLNPKLKIEVNQIGQDNKTKQEA